MQQIWHAIGGRRRSQVSVLAAGDHLPGTPEEDYAELGVRPPEHQDRERRAS